MFDLGWDEMALIAVVALVVLGPKELPNALRTVSGLMKQARKLAGEFQNGVNEIIREADLEDAKNAISNLNKGTITEAIEKHLDADGEIKTALQKPVDIPAASDAIKPAIITDGAPAVAALTADGAVDAVIAPESTVAETAGAETNPAVAAFAPGGSATQMPEFVHGDALGEAAATAQVDVTPMVEGDLTATPVEAAQGGIDHTGAEHHNESLRQAAAESLATESRSTESRPTGPDAPIKNNTDSEKSKIS